MKIPFTYFGFSFGLSTVYIHSVYKGNLYVAWQIKVFFYHSWNNTIKRKSNSHIEGTTGQAWNIQVVTIN
jgi:hypothetical protein